MRVVKTVAAVGTAALLVLGGGAAAGAAAGLPQGFLLYEAKAEGPKKSWETWKIDDSLRTPLTLNPCHVERPWDGRRSAARSITYVAETDLLNEQVVVYRSERAARAAMAGLRSQLKRCAKTGKGYDAATYRWKGVGIGDEALRAGGSYFESRFRYVAARHGRAVIVYGEDGNFTSKLANRHFRGLERDARKMAAKVCDLPGVC
ncbi:hypothetical protein GCM10010156_58180 [Planobispora rosea]|uniref:PknH-like extracellular domain-containing protein n=1 Tax=Planobispora rosea TaxID=35762 RepID=A0A8J3WGR8_PLARO|nr:hypothetical protein [Planobispora rosea]GGS92263.1 hypothetical protein GCM10010156_58180 [Planobispora rosea]GIH87121.1 hypothetical protein Pro02_55290 [Planobispora rosea]